MKTAIAAACLSVAVCPAMAAIWSVSKNEQDPFDKEKSTFIATTLEGSHSLAVRCLEGHLSFAVGVDAGAIGKSDEVGLRIVADGKDPISAEGAVLGASVFLVMIQFGDQDTLDYLQNAKKYFVRIAGGATTQTFGFTGGRSFDEVLNRARKACGVAAYEPPKPAPSPAVAPAARPIPQASIPAKWAKRDCTKETSCAQQYECLSARHELGDAPDPDGFSDWCKNQPGMNP